MPQLLIHRGLAKKKFLENSIKSFNYCFNKNYGIETDIHATKDKEFICFHDFSLKRVFKKNLSVKNLNYSKIKEISTKLDKQVPLLRLVKVVKKQTLFIYRDQTNFLNTSSQKTLERDI